MGEGGDLSCLHPGSVLEGIRGHVVDERLGHAGGGAKGVHVLVEPQWEGTVFHVGDGGVDATKLELLDHAGRLDVAETGVADGPWGGADKLDHAAAARLRLHSGRLRGACHHDLVEAFASPRAGRAPDQDDRLVGAAYAAPVGYLAGEDVVDLLLGQV